MEKSMEKEENILMIVYYNMMENILMVENGMVKDMMKMVI